MVVDMSKCRGDCVDDCLAACHEIHNVPYIPKPEHEVKWLFLEPYENAFPERSHRFLSKRDREKNFFLLCNHCENPPCVRACPTQATFKREKDGIVMIDYHRCIGCRFCMAACPYGSRSFNFRDPRPFIKKINPEYPTRRKGVVEKCNFCQELLEVGRIPACVGACKEGVLTFGVLEDPTSEVRRLLSEKPHIRRKPNLGTGPSVFYIT
jgi:Fe-S-cluster-containing dehydrogenase component